MALTTKGVPTVRDNPFALQPMGFTDVLQHYAHLILSIYRYTITPSPLKSFMVLNPNMGRSYIISRWCSLCKTYTTMNTSVQVCGLLNKTYRICKWIQTLLEKRTGFYSLKFLPLNFHCIDFPTFIEISVIVHLLFLCLHLSSFLPTS